MILKGNRILAISGMEVNGVSSSRAAIFSLFSDLYWRISNCCQRRDSLCHLVARSIATAPPRDLPKTNIFSVLMSLLVRRKSRAA